MKIEIERCSKYLKQTIMRILRNNLLHVTPHSCDSLQFESFIRQQQIMEEEPSDKWDFGGDSNLCIKDFTDARKQCDTIVQSGRSNEMLHDSWPMNVNPATLKLARKGTSSCCLGESLRKRFHRNHSQNLIDNKREQDLHCGEYQRKSESGFQGVNERGDFLSDSQLKNKATSETPKNYSMSTFLSSMDDGKFDKRKTFQVDGQMVFLLDGKPLHTYNLY